MDEDVTTLTDEQLNEAVGTGETPVVPESKEEEIAEVEEQPEEVIEEAEEKTQSEEEKPASRREQLRIQQLLTKYPNLNERVQAPSQKNEFIENLDAEPEVIERLTADNQSQYNAGVAATRAEIRSSEWTTLLNIDTPQVLTNNKWLNPKSAEFQPAIADAVNEEYLSLVGYDKQTGMVSNPGIRYSDFIEARVELSTRLAKAMTAETTKNLVKQTASTGLRPDGSSAKRMNLNQAPENMSDEELYAAIGQKAPKK